MLSAAVPSVASAAVPHAADADRRQLRRKRTPQHITRTFTAADSTTKWVDLSEEGGVVGLCGVVQATESVSWRVDYAAPARTSRHPAAARHFSTAPSLSEVMLLGRGASGMAMEVHPGALI